MTILPLPVKEIEANKKAEETKQLARENAYSVESWRDPTVKVEQLSIATNEIHVWPNVEEAITATLQLPLISSSRYFLKKSMTEIGEVGGFKWRYAPAGSKSG
jgi:hypothetical protein